MVWLITFSEVITDPLGAIWMRPLDYREITKDTLYESEPAAHGGVPAGAGAGGNGGGRAQEIELV